MKEVRELKTIGEVDAFLAEHELSFLYVSTPGCSTCESLMPKLRELLDDYSPISFGHADASEVEEVAERFLILAAPIMLLLIGGREYLREDRFVRFGPLREKLDRICGLYQK
ncbi:thioredoxin family protein [Saccharibacillus alkalitolerans]|uniref:Thioredoxin family protein n=1 Tax=Saccharibacillus alkalitolerans TaxID=2705290 RepID=A0ABX0F4G4_9BACL|nr:thioredoxin family protein [Saccharibacillus alkalitolerans]NGZ74809.1 thioredoxin family protein [Saccharibacillus alkalitolerans]